jgi:hypothetical protein
MRSWRKVQPLFQVVERVTVLAAAEKMASIMRMPTTTALSPETTKLRLINTTYYFIANSLNSRNNERLGVYI